MKTLNSKMIFFGLQVADLLTTLVCFKVGLTEMGPVTARLILAFGVLGGLLISKVLACLAVLPLKKLVWLGNVLYGLIVAWNLLLAGIFGLAKVLHP